VWRPLPCPCVAIAALSPITVLRLHVERVVLYLHGRSPGAACGGIWPFSDLATGAHQLALVLVPCQATQGPCFTVPTSAATKHTSEMGVFQTPGNGLLSRCVPRSASYTACKGHICRVSQISEVGGLTSTTYSHTRSMEVLT
jgi:hypothetical protein